MADDVRADRHSNRLLDFEGKVFFTEHVYGDKQKIACAVLSVELPLSFCKPQIPHTCLLRSEDVVGSKSY